MKFTLSICDMYKFRKYAYYEVISKICNDSRDMSPGVSSGRGFLLQKSRVVG
jgi:hypothetical protein